jgi:hypothetical protein
MNRDLPSPCSQFAPWRKAWVLAALLVSLVLAQPAGFCNFAMLAQANDPLNEEEQDEESFLAVGIRTQRPTVELSRLRVHNSHPASRPANRGWTHAAPVQTPRCELDRRNGFGAPLLL